jgi:hypothetical protein
MLVGSIEYKIFLVHFQERHDAIADGDEEGQIPD